MMAQGASWALGVFATLIGEVVVLAPTNETTPPATDCDTVPTSSYTVPLTRVTDAIDSPPPPIDSPANVCDVNTSGLPTTLTARPASDKACCSASR